MTARAMHYHASDRSVVVGVGASLVTMVSSVLAEVAPPLWTPSMVTAIGGLVLAFGTFAASFIVPVFKTWVEFMVTKRKMGIEEDRVRWERHDINNKLNRATLELQEAKDDLAETRGEWARTSQELIAAKDEIILLKSRMVSVQGQVAQHEDDIKLTKKVAIDNSERISHMTGEDSGKYPRITDSDAHT